MLNLKRQMDTLLEPEVFMKEQLSFLVKNIWMKNSLLHLQNLKRIKKKYVFVLYMYFYISIELFDENILEERKKKKTNFKKQQFLSIVLLSSNQIIKVNLKY